MLTIEIDEHSGFCFGVTTAIGKAEEELAVGRPLDCLGDIVHNGSECDRLRGLGLVTIGHEEFDRLHGARVLLRAHGEPPATYATARRNGIENVEFFCGDAAQLAADFAGRGLRPDVICVDPPRKGLSADVIEAMVRMAPQRIVYVSCDPATLARDVRSLTQQGYALTHAEAVDLFPRCAHVETVCRLERVE